MKTKQELKKTFNETQCKYEVIIFRNDTPICTEWLNELKKQQIIDGRVRH